MNTAYIPIILSAIVSAVAAFTPVIQDYIAAHPTVALLVGALYSIIASLAPSPLKKGGADSK